MPKNQLGTIKLGGHIPSPNLNRIWYMDHKLKGHLVLKEGAKTGSNRFWAGQVRGRRLMASSLEVRFPGLPNVPNEGLVLESYKDMDMNVDTDIDICLN